MNTDGGSRLSWAGLATEFAESSEKWNAGFIIQKSLRISGPSPVVQWLGLQASTAGGMDSIPGQGTKIPHAAGAAKKKSLRISKEWQQSTKPSSVPFWVWGPVQITAQVTGPQSWARKTLTRLPVIHEKSKKAYARK